MNNGRIIKNEFLLQLTTTPISLVWTIRECLVNEEPYLVVERVIENMMLRRDGTYPTDLSEYKKVFEEMAFLYLIDYSDEQGIHCCGEQDFYKLVDQSVKQLKNRNDEKFRRIIENKSENEIAKMFYTDISLMEYRNGNLRFSCLIYAYHLAAKKIIRLLNEETEIMKKTLELLEYEYRYKLIVIASTIVKYISSPVFSGEFSFECPLDIPEKMESVIFEYIKNKWDDSTIDKDEKKRIVESIKNLINKEYGDNIFTDRNAKKDHFAWLERIANVY